MTEICSKKEVENFDGAEDWNDDSDDEPEESQDQVAPLQNVRKSIFKSSRRLSGMPNMLVNSLSPQQDLDAEEISNLRIILSQFPDPPEKIVTPPSTYSNMSQTAAKYLKGFWK